MKTQEFLEKFLSDYYSNDDIARFQDLVLFCDENIFFEEFIELQDKLFKEALQNFTDKICQKQRKNCLKCFVEHKLCNKESNILYAEQPQISEI